VGRKVELPSGAMLEITVSPLKEGKALYMAIAREMAAVAIQGQDQLFNLLKNVIMAGLASKEIDDAIEACMKRVTYNGLKIDDSTFDPEERRQDYFFARYEVAYDNVLPFLKPLLSKYPKQLERARSILKSLFEMTND